MYKFLLLLLCGCAATPAPQHTYKFHAGQIVKDKITDKKVYIEDTYYGRYRIRYADDLGKIYYNLAEEDVLEEINDK